MLRENIVELPAANLEDAALQSKERGVVADFESGSVVLLTEVGFPLTEGESKLLDPRILGKPKNVSFSPSTGRVTGTSCVDGELDGLTAMMDRYSKLAVSVVSSLFPGYGSRLRVMRTSFRPAEIVGRHSSWRKDDTRLHVDSFPSQPTHGDRILRVFCNVNRSGKPRMWRVGEPFEDVARRFLPKVGRPFPGSAGVMRALGITKSLRSEYDHTMLKLHDAMKADDEYQRSAGSAPINFQPGSIWLCFADSVSHSVHSGQHMFEQTIVLPVDAMSDEGKAPLRILEQLRGRPLA